MAWLDARRVRVREMAARVAGFPAIKALDGYAFDTGAPKKQLQELASLAFAARARTFGSWSAPRTWCCSDPRAWAS